MRTGAQRINRNYNQINVRVFAGTEDSDGSTEQSPQTAAATVQSIAGLERKTQNETAEPHTQ